MNCLHFRITRVSKDFFWYCGVRIAQLFVFCVLSFGDGIVCFMVIFFCPFCIFCTFYVDDFFIWKREPQYIFPEKWIPCANLLNTFDVKLTTSTTYHQDKENCLHIINFYIVSSYIIIIMNFLTRGNIKR